MKQVSCLLIISLCMLVFSCSEEKSERFVLLTTPTWAADTLLANGEDASGPGELLEDFDGDAKFREDGTGYFGDYTGTWALSPDETKITINSPSIALPIVCTIAELTNLSLKITTAVPDTANPLIPINIRMTFKAK